MDRVETPCICLFDCYPPSRNRVHRRLDKKCQGIQAFPQLRLVTCNLSYLNFVVTTSFKTKQLVVTTATYCCACLFCVSYIVNGVDLHACLSGF